MSSSHSTNQIRRPTRLLLTSCACLVASNLLVACADTDPADVQGAVTSEEQQPANDIPLNPPELRFTVAADGQVGASPEREAEAGEALALVLDNDSDQDYKLRLYDPEGKKVFGMTAPAMERIDGRALPRITGQHWIEIHPVGAAGSAQRFPVEVTEN